MIELCCAEREDRCHQEDGPAHFEAGRRRARVPGGDRHPEQARPPQPGHAHRLLRRRQAPVRRLRVHAQRQPPGHPQWYGDTTVFTIQRWQDDVQR